MFGKYGFLEEKNEEVILPEECKSDSTELLSLKESNTNSDIESFNTTSIDKEFLQNKTRNSKTNSKKAKKTVNEDKKYKKNNKLKNVTNLSQDLNKNKRSNKKVGIHLKKDIETEETEKLKTRENTSLQKTIDKINKKTKSPVKYTLFNNQVQKYKPWSRTETETLINLNKKYPKKWTKILKFGEDQFDSSRNIHDLCAKMQNLEKNGSYNIAIRRCWIVKFVNDKEETKEVIKDKIPCVAALKFAKKYRLGLKKEKSKIISVSEKENKNIENDEEKFYLVEMCKNKIKVRRLTLFIKP
ncbi:hypothetical protein EHP00_367 [Ecytonucleospora hepatopenaei]|uniref:Uncharacterized protein n=1 Tax=Ecytonucleospora hepatopenaei TaxID=646526 RepID=A0A1W0E990_9MICR|nr:hypothetical protein EHP00_367 [Ecytonucleospora hepatopenaei]